ncbi:DNA topoisomerase I, partial [Candidatus Woesearchaeota archaeon]|nr:DNA topoisomerase I [Candidatus Woesearchaeota archaeon]
MTELIICEKPKAALKIAQALADKTPKKEVYLKKIPYYSLKHSGKNIIVGSAVGHLFGLAESGKKTWTYPVFDIEWKPIFETHKNAGFSKKYHDCLKKLCKGIKKITVACDYDVEGEVIGLNIVRYICKKKDANRMKFSTLTEEDLVEAYEHKSKHLDWGQANAGETRHFLDFYYGVNLSRALISSIKAAGSFQIMSTGRVQGPALKMVVDREREIRAFTPVPFWQIELIGSHKKKEIHAWHEKDKFWKKKEANDIYKKIKNEKKAGVADVKRIKFKQTPPNPFDLTSLQIESYKCLRISPKETLSLAQELYTSGYISYPRTSSNQLPAKIGYHKILKMIGRQKSYEKLAGLLSAKKKLTPNNGKKTDPAHPAIYPTGTMPKKLGERERKVYDLITSRFMATFGDDAVRETMQINLDCKKEIFIAKGTRTVEKGWHIFYEPYLK